MTVVEPNVNDGDKLNVTQAAAILGIHRNTLRMHTDAGLIRCVVSRRTGYRRYMGRDIKRYWREQ